VELGMKIAYPAARGFFSLFNNVIYDLIQHPNVECKIDLSINPYIPKVNIWNYLFTSNVVCNPYTGNVIQLSHSIRINEHDLTTTLSLYHQVFNDVLFPILKNDVKTKIQYKFEKYVGAHYRSIDIKHTYKDYKLDTIKDIDFYISELKKFDSPKYLSTDMAVNRQKFKKAIPDIEFLNASVPANDASWMSYACSASKATIIDLFVDCYTLSLCNNLIINSISNFSRAALYLAKPNIDNHMNVLTFEI
jgi:hypothetical protein